jgi:hypothetical protein
VNLLLTKLILTPLVILAALWSPGAGATLSAAGWRDCR